MYKIHDWYDDKWKYCFDWWELVSYCKEVENKIAHSKNDIYSYYDFKFNKNPNEFVDYEMDIVNKAKKLLMGEYKNDYYVENKRYVYVRELIIYDEWDVIVNLGDIRQGIKEYKELPPKKRKQSYWTIQYYKKHSFVFRKEPVPGISNGRWARSKWRGNKNYLASLQETIHLFPCDGRTRSRIKDLTLWDDRYRSTSRSWKRKKIKKQWMKRL